MAERPRVYTGPEITRKAPVLLEFLRQNGHPATPIVFVEGTTAGQVCRSPKTTLNRVFLRFLYEPDPTGVVVVRDARQRRATLTRARPRRRAGRRPPPARRPASSAGSTRRRTASRCARPSRGCATAATATSASWTATRSSTTPSAGRSWTGSTGRGPSSHRFDDASCTLHGEVESH
jgi:hypothetical protein